MTNRFPCWLANLFFFTISHQLVGQGRLHSDDLPRFYVAYDSVLTTTDTARQNAFIQRLYVDKASSGLKEFMELRGGNTRSWRKFIAENRASLAEKRPWILSVLKQEPEIRMRLAIFKRLYPNFRDGDVYFCVGINNSGGTIRDRTVYIGTEVAANSAPNWAVYLVMHEFAHTQQWTQRHYTQLMADKQLGQDYERTHQNLLGFCLLEGMADFVAELVLGKPIAESQPDGYIAFGLKHEPAIWKQFRPMMNQKFNHKDGWLYAQREVDGQPMRDLGYFVGYQICKCYYTRATDKKQALNHLIGLNLTDENAAQFLRESGYQAQPTSNQ